MNIDREFIKWFYEETYPEQGSNRRQCYGMTAGTTNIDIIDYWMREAFKAGVQAASSPDFHIGTLDAQKEFDKKRNYPL
jgi:hypothetical protein